MALSVERIRQSLSDGLLSFPITDMDDQGSFSAGSYHKRIERFVTDGVSSIFVAGGTGEFFSLSLEEYKQILTVSMEAVNGRVPVIASAGRSIPEAKAFCETAENAGIDAILLMPPYLTECPEDGIMSYAREIIQSTSLPVVYYNRANGFLSAENVRALADECPNLIALKDGVGDMAALNDTIRTVGDRLVYIGGVPTAEIIAEAYLSIGVNTYSSAVYNFMPEMAMRFYKALRAGDSAAVSGILKTFFIPFCRLRDQKKGYAVSLIKSGADIVGHSAGSVRAPLTMPSQKEKATLSTIIQANR